MTFPAFKEWHVIVEALGAGEQIIILRKGGISEGRAGFQIEASRFWLFPTRFHAQLEKTKPAAARWFEPPSPGRVTSDAAPATVGSALRTDPELTTGSVSLRYFADIAHTAFLTDWPAVARLDPHHLWTQATVRERFDWSNSAGLHAIVVRVHKLTTPLFQPLTPVMSGCKSWIELPCDFAAQPSAPVLSEAVFDGYRAALSL